MLHSDASPSAHPPLGPQGTGAAAFASVGVDSSTFPAAPPPQRPGPVRPGLSSKAFSLRRLPSSAQINMAQEFNLPARKWTKSLVPLEKVRSEPLAKFAFGCIPATSSTRLKIVALVEHPAFVAGMLLVIFINAIFLAIYDPVANEFNTPSVPNDILFYSEVYFIVIYTIEMLLNMVAYGVFWEGPYTYLKHGWFILDFLIVVLGWIGYILNLTYPGGAPAGINAIRTLRPLRVLQYIPGIDILERTLIRSRKMLANVCVIFFLLAFTFDLIGVAAFNGKLHQKCGWSSEANGTEWFVYAPTMFRYCSLEPSFGQQCPDAYVQDPTTGENRSVVCVSAFNFPKDNITQVNPWGGWSGFDNILQGMLTVLILVTQDGWSDYMAAYRDTNGDASQMYFIFLELSCTTIILSLLIAVLVVNFSLERKRKENPELFETADDSEEAARLEKIDSVVRERRSLVSAKTAKLVSDMELRLIWSYRRHHTDADYAIVTPAAYEIYKGRHSEAEIDEFGLRLFAKQKAREQTLYPESRNAVFQKTSRQRSFSSVGEDRIPEFEPDMETGPPLHVQTASGIVARGHRPGASWISEQVCNLVEHPIFSGIMIGFIVINTVLLMTYYFNQPVWLSRVQEWGNLALTGVFTVEMFLKLFGLGLRKYLNEPFDIFDGFIVTISWIDIVISFAITTRSTGLTILRTLRTLRIFKVMRYIPVAARLLKVLGLTVWASIPFFGLFIVWMYVFTVSGLLIFGGNMNLPPYVRDPTSGDDIANFEWTCTSYVGGFYADNYTRCPAASNYDTLIWAILTSVQILTKENWSDIMFHACTTANSWVPVIYFLIVIIMGTYVVLNLFIAVIIDSFLQSQEKIQKRILQRNSSSLKGSSPAPSDTSSQISEDEDTPVDFKKWAQSKLIYLDGDLKRHIRVTDLPPFARRSRSLNLFPAHSRFRIAVATFISSKIVEYFIIVVILLACVLLIIENPSNATNATLLSLDYFVDAVFFSECICKVIALGFIMHEGAYLRSGWNQLDFIIVIAAILDLCLANNPEFQAVRALRALRPLRLISKIEGAKVAVIAMLKSMRPVCLVASMVFVFLLIFALFGVSLFGGLFYSCLDSSSSSYGIYYDSFVDPSTGLYFVDRLCFPYANYFVSNCPPELQCVGSPGQVAWDNPSFSLGGGAKFAFDNIGESLMIMWEISLLSLWLEPTRRAVAGTAIGHQPARYNQPSMAIFFIVYIFVFSFFFTQLFVATVVETFLSTNDRISGRAFLTEKQREWVDVQGKAHLLPFKKRPEPPRNQPLRALVWHLVRWKYFDPCIICVIIVNTGFLATVHYDMSPVWIQVLTITDYLFGAVYLSEAALKLFVWRHRYFMKLANLFDFFIVVTIIATWSLADSPNAQTTGVFAALRVLRVFRLAGLIRGINVLFTTLRFAVPAIINVGLLLFLLYFIYSCMGVQLFYGFPATPGQIEYSNFATLLFNFNTFGNAFVTLFRISTLATWNGVMRDYATVTWLIWPYVISFIFAVVYLLLNLFVAVLLGNFTTVITKSSKNTVSQTSLIEYRRVWGDLAQEYRAEYLAMLKRNDKEGVCSDEHLGFLAQEILTPTMLPSPYFIKLFERLQPPLGFRMVKFLTRAQLITHINTLNIPLTPSGMLGYRTTLKALVDIAVLQSKKDQNLVGDDVMSTALNIALRLQERQSSKRIIDYEHSASSHDLAHELAARRVQLSGRYVLQREKIQSQVQNGLMSESEAKRLLEELRLEYLSKANNVTWAKHSFSS